MPMTPASERPIDPASGGELPNSVVLEIDARVDVDSVVLAVRRDGELIELAERTAPATAELHGDLE